MVKLILKRDIKHDVSEFYSEATKGPADEYSSTGHTNKPLSSDKFCVGFKLYLIA